MYGALTSLPLERVNPFRLIAIFPAHGHLVEWRWDLKSLERRQHKWSFHQWASSGFDEPEAQRMRVKVTRAALKQKTTGTLGWLRRLHRSHAPKCGPFSICMHREDAATVSYTEIVVSGRETVMRHHSGAPCFGRKHSEYRLLRV
jgi:hypothetical protein